LAVLLSVNVILPVSALCVVVDWSIVVVV